ncbi:glutamate-cysteine ligase-domain-containing protein [Lipomyces kononenkoae]|uniref:Glutamate-cysteine ligase-domain-containing protein n=1 Tax=Lipomyces kononenkoae TaxID=34357 RepID=A0ACC3SZ31_LIPKO
MGLLSLGTPLPWKEVQKYADHVREHGIEQFLHIWKNTKDERGNSLLWGDEVEYMVVSYDHENKSALLSLRQAEILTALEENEKRQRKIEDELGVGSGQRIPTFHPEYGRYMLEATPGQPYTASLEDLLNVERNMNRRREIAKEHMLPHEIPVTLTSFPRLGAPGQFTDPYYAPIGNASRSFFLPDELINPHARFPTLTANIRERRGSKVAMNVPIFKDKNTPSPFIDPTVPYDRNLYPEDANARQGAALPDHIYMDSMGFGMGCCCLQITFQATDIDEARRLYDQLAPLGPIFLALTAASPAWRGYLSDQDCRWNVIAGSVDDRTEEERGGRPLKNQRFVIPKSRYDSIDYYISQSRECRPEYNDLDLVMDDKLKKKLTDAGVDDKLANHYAHLFIRDPIVVFSELVDQDDTTSSDHFENIQSTNWQTMRFKPPPPGTNIGWRVEFRSMEIQITDFENAAFAIFIVLLTRAILSFKLNFYIPISKVDRNMQVAHRRDAVINEKFYFRKDIFAPLYHSHDVQSNGSETASEDASVSLYSSDANASTDSIVNKTVKPVEEEYDMFTIDEIINGRKPKPTSNGPLSDVEDEMNEFPGLVRLVQDYLDSMSVDVETRCTLNAYMDLISKRASGELYTAARWIREFIRGHPKYQFDSVVGSEVNYDLVRTVEQLTLGNEWNGAGESLLGGMSGARYRSS